MNAPSNRRRFLQLTGAGAIGSLAGCNQLDTDTVPSQDGGFDAGDGVVTQVGPDQQEMQAIQQEVMSQAEEEGWDQAQVQEEIQQRQQDRIEEEVDAFDSFADDHGDISIEDRVAEVGVFLLDGSDEALLDALRNEDIDVLLPGALFEDVRSSSQE